MDNVILPRAIVDVKKYEKILKEEVYEAMRYWEAHYNDYCESGSPRDHLAIRDISIFIEYIKQMEAET